MMTMNNDSHMTLDPPGRIAVIGAGPLGLEAALYGRFLGYDVTVFERGEVGQSLLDCLDQPLPMLPSACLSPLAWSAIGAQGGSDQPPRPQALPLTIGQWLTDGLQRLAKTDLLRQRVLTGCEVVAVELIEVPLEAQSPESQTSISSDAAETVDEEEMYVDGDVPPDFRLSITGTDIPSYDFEAVVLASGNADVSLIAGIDQCRQSPYFFQIGGRAATAADDSLDTPETALRTGWRQIVRAFARLGGRAELDLYRPVRF
jgi:hypothetical protein